MCSVILSAALFVDLDLLPENERLAGKRKREKRKEKGKKRSANEADQPKHKHCRHDQKRDLKLRGFLDRQCVSVLRAHLTNVSSFCLRLTRR